MHSIKEILIETNYTSYQLNKFFSNKTNKGRSNLVCNLFFGIKTAILLFIVNVLLIQKIVTEKKAH